MDEADEGVRAEHRLVAYWQAHPAAADTAEGIRRWWLGEPPPSAAAVHAALGRLVDRGLVVAVRAADARVRYRWQGEGPPA